MTTLQIELPDAVRRQIEELASLEGFSPSQFVASAVTEKLAVWQTMNHLRAEAAQGRRANFERFLDAVPDVSPVSGDELH